MKAAPANPRTVWLTPPRLAMVWAAALVFVTAGYFQNTRPGWNVNSQFGLTCAIVERGTLSIDAYHARPATETNDKAFYNGHFYCDKSPVTAFLGVPALWVYNAVRRGALGLPMDYAAARWWTAWAVEGGAAALLAALLVVLLLRRGVAPRLAAFAAFLWIAATPLLAYAILFYSYLPACALALGGFLLVEPLWHENHPTDPSYLPVFLGGLLFGLASWTLNTMALVALVVTAGVALAPGSAGRRLARLAVWAAGGVLGFAGHFIYTWWVFGSLGSAYQYEADPFFREQMARGLMGATHPRLWVAWLITFHPSLGLFLVFPVAAAGLAGCLAALWRPRAGRRDALLALAALAGLILYNSAYFMWWGGNAYAPRHLVPGLTLLAVGLAPWLASVKKWPAPLFFFIGAAGLIVNIVAVSINPQHPLRVPIDLLLQPDKVDRFPSPMYELHYTFWKIGYTDRNWGTALGLRGPASLIPLALIWGLAFWLALRDRAVWRE